MNDAARKAVEHALRHFAFMDDEEATRVAGHVLAVLSGQHAVVELPEPETGATWPVEDLTVRGYVDGSIQLRVYNSVRGSTLAKTYEASVGPDLAAALLAAARFAEGAGR